MFRGKDILETRKRIETFRLDFVVRVRESAASEATDEFELHPGECMDVPIGLVHQLEALEDSELFEFSTQHFESDSHRLVRGD